MKNLLILFFASAIIFACDSKALQHYEKKFPTKNLKIYSYKEEAIPLFFNALFLNHYHNFKTAKASDYKSFCERYSLLEKDSLNQVQFHRALFFQQLFTSRKPSNCSQKGALKIPYFWNWVDPNPRSEIVYLPSGKKMNRVKPPTEFNKYASMAYVDRTPSLYLKDLTSEKANYYHSGCDTFYTFGWCSEREMSYTLLMTFFGYSGKVVVSGAHSWSELWTEFNTAQGKPKSIILRADNTYDEFDFFEPQKNLIKSIWLNDFGPDKYCKWYNQKARSATEKEKVSQTVVGKKASERMEKLVVSYFFE